MHYFENFKGFAKVELDLFNPLTVLIGPNGSGKSNAIEGVELLSAIAHGTPLHQITDIGRGSGGLEVRGGLPGCPRSNRSSGRTSFTLGFSAFIGFEGETEPFDYRVKVRVKPQPRIAEESLLLGAKTLIFKTVEGSRSATSGDVNVEYNNFTGGRNPKVSTAADRSVLSQYEHISSKNKREQQCLQVVHGIMAYLRASFVFDPQPTLIRGYERVGNKVLARNGANLSAVLYALDQGGDAEKQSLNQLLEWIRQLPEEPYDSFEFITTKINDVIFGLRQGENGPLVDARLLSDGTLRSLAVLAAIETVSEKSRVVIEEFDNGLHPSRVGILTNAMASSCERRGLNVLLTTHNPATLDTLREEQLQGVVVCAWDKKKRAFHLIRLKEIPRYDELLERGRLGDLVTKRTIEQYLDPGFDMAHKKQIKQWFAGLS